VKGKPVVSYCHVLYAGSTQLKLKIAGREVFF